VRNREILIERLQEFLKKQTTEYWNKELETSKVPYGPINNMKQTFEDPQVIHRKMVEEVEHPINGKMKLVGLPVKYSENPCTIRLAPPLLGEHTNLVLDNILGYSKKEIEKLNKEKVIKQFFSEEHD